MLQETLGDIVYVQLPEVDTELEQFGKTVFCLIVFCIKVNTCTCMWICQFALNERKRESRVQKSGKHENYQCILETVRTAIVKFHPIGDSWRQWNLDCESNSMIAEYFVMVMSSFSFWQRVSIACYAERCLSYDRFCLTVCPTVRHTLVSCQNDSSYDHVVFTGG